MYGTPLTEEEQERAKVLNASGKTPNYIAKGMNRNRRTVAKYLDKPEVREVVSIQREELAGMFDSVAHRTLVGVTSEDIQKSTLQQKMVSAGIAVDKAALLRDQPTARIDVSALLEVVDAIKAQERVERPSQAPALLPPEPEP